MVKNTLMERTRKGELDPVLEFVARTEQVPLEQIATGIKTGTIVIPGNPLHRSCSPRGIGQGLRTKVNANIGMAEGLSSVETETQKMNIAVAAGADAIMDLSTGGNVLRMIQNLIPDCPVPFGTVPIYQAAVGARESRGSIVEMSAEDMFAAVAEQAAAGVDFMTIHAGVTGETLRLLEQHTRIADVVSRGGAFMLAWMLFHQKENPFYEHFDRVLDIARRHEITVSLGDALRPGAVADATDRLQVQELLTLGGLVDRCRRAGVQCLVEGPGHVPLHQITANIVLQKQLCGNAPFYVLGPLVTDVAPGYDHITSAIGGAIAASAGADFLCYVTPAEHLGLPNAEQVKEGVIASRIAAHAADLAKGVPKAWEWDREMAAARKALDWPRQQELALDPDVFQPYLESRLEEGECSMCGPFCAMKVISQAMGGKKVTC